MRALLTRVKRASVAKFGLASLLPRGLSIITALVITPLAIAKLGVTEYGFWVLATQLPSMILSPDLGLTNGLVNELGPVHRREGGLASQRTRLHNVQRLLTVIALAWLLIGIVGIIAYAGMSMAGDEAALLMITMGVGLFVFIAGIPPMVWTRAQLAQERGHEYVLMEGVGKAATLILSVAVLLLLPPSPVTLVMAYMVPTSAMAWFNAWRYRRREFPGTQAINRKIPMSRVYRSERLLFRTGGLFVLMQLAYVIGTAIDPYIVGAFADADAVAYVNVLKQPFNVLPLVVTMAAPALWPMFQRLLEARQYSRVSRLLLGATGGSALAMGFGSILLIVARDPIYGFLGAGQISPSVPDLVACGALVIASTVASILTPYLQAANLLKAQAIVLIAAAVTTAALKVLALSFYGLTAFLAISAAGYLVLTTLPLGILAARSLARKPAAADQSESFAG